MKVVTNGSRIAFNLSNAVGPRQPNGQLDVQLVQFGFYCLSRTSREARPILKQAAAQVRVGLGYTGLPNDPLSIAIREHQAQFGKTRDGIVSPLPPGLSMSYGGGVYRTFAYLLANISDEMGDNWPMLHRHPQCPPQVRSFVKDACTLV